MKRIIIILTAFFVFSNQVFCQAPATKENVRTLLEITGSAKVGIMVLENMINTYKKSLPAVPDEFWQNLSSEFKAETLIDLLTPIYARHYSDAEVLKLIEFYKSPLGKKVIEKMPLIAQESYTA